MSYIEMNMICYNFVYINIDIHYNKKGKIKYI